MDLPQTGRLPKNRALRGIYLMVNRYLSHGVAIQSAALAFYLLFTIFPLLIFFSSLLGVLHLDVNAILLALGRFLPENVVDFAEMYLNYVSQNANIQLVWFGLVFSIYFPMRATNVLLRAVRTAYHLGPPSSPVGHLLKTLLYTGTLIVTIVASVALLTVGDVALHFAVSRLGLPVGVAELWQRLRFPLTATLMFLALYFLYALAQNNRQPQRNLWPGALAALVGWLVVSLVYSFYVENFASYSLLYGSIGAVIALLVWLCLSATVLIMGAELNGTLLSLRRERRAGISESSNL